MFRARVSSVWTLLHCLYSSSKKCPLFYCIQARKKIKRKIIRRNQIDSYERVSSVRKSGSSLSANHKSFTFPSDFWRYFSNRYRVKQENNDRVTETKVICSEENI